MDQSVRTIHRPHVLRRIGRNQLWEEIAGLSEYLLKRGHAIGTIQQYLQAIEHLGTWMRRRGITTAELNELVVRRFLGHLAVCCCPPPASHDAKTLEAAARRLMDLLRETHRIPERCAPAATPVDREVEQFDRHLVETCGLARNTRTYCRRYVRQFLAGKFGRGAFKREKIKPRDLMNFVSEQAAQWKPGTAKVMVCALRAYFRYLQLRGLCTPQLRAAIPTIPVWKLASIPKTVSGEDLRQFLSSFDRSTATGLRDHAMARCMIECGLRVCEVADLHLSDIDWRQATLHVRGSKTRRSRLLPLTTQLGRAIAAYVRNGRPRSGLSGLFLLHKAPWTQSTAFTVRGALRRAYDRSGAARWSGPHALRHTVAARMVQKGARLKEVADVLGHASIDTTTIYAKVNLPMLRQVAMPWPGKVQR